MLVTVNNTWNQVALIKNFLKAHQQEVEGMLDTEYNQAEIIELFKEDGRKEGIDEHLVGQVCKKLLRVKIKIR